MRAAALSLNTMERRMKAVHILGFGSDPDLVALVDVPEPDEPGANEVVLDILAAPINPSDLLNFQGRFGARPPPLPCLAGGEAVGQVRKLGKDVRHLRIGDRVLALFAGRGNWCQQVTAPAAGLRPLPKTADIHQLAMMAVNPATAWHMLKGFVALEPGEWVLQNAGNSAVAHNVIKLAKHMRVRTVSIVRSESQIEAVMASGADAVVADGPDLTERIQAAVGGAPIRLAFDAVAGEGTAALGRCLVDGGTVVTYGLLSSASCRVDASDLVFRNIALRGYWFTHWFENASVEERNAVYDVIAKLIEQGVIDVRVEAIYPMDDVKTAVAHAARTDRAGKVILLPNPDLL